LWRREKSSFRQGRDNRDIFIWTLSPTHAHNNVNNNNTAHAIYISDGKLKENIFMFKQDDTGSHSKTKEVDREIVTENGY